MNSQPKQLQPWQVLKTKEIFVAEPWLRLSVQQLHLPDGQVVEDYYQITLQEYATIFAQTSDGRVILERQYKHGIGRVSLTLPGGAIAPGEDPLLAAQRELLEETGYVADRWQSLGSFVPSTNYGCGKAHFFMAQAAEPVAEPDSGDLEEMEIVLLTLAELVAAIQQGEVASMGAIATIALAMNPIFAKLTII